MPETKKKQFTSRKDLGFIPHGFSFHKCCQWIEENGFNVWKTMDPDQRFAAMKTFVAKK